MRDCSLPGFGIADAALPFEGVQEVLSSRAYAREVSEVSDL